MDEHGQCSGRGSAEREPEVQTVDGHYFLQRAEAELELAQRATHPRAVAAHFQLAEAYLDRAYGADDFQTGAQTAALAKAEPTDGEVLERCASLVA